MRIRVSRPSPPGPSLTADPRAVARTGPGTRQPVYVGLARVRLLPRRRPLGPPVQQVAGLTSTPGPGPPSPSPRPRRSPTVGDPRRADEGADLPRLPRHGLGCGAVAEGSHLRHRGRGPVRAVPRAGVRVHGRRHHARPRGRHEGRPADDDQARLQVATTSRAPTSPCTACLPSTSTRRGTGSRTRLPSNAREAGGGKAEPASVAPDAKDRQLVGVPRLRGLP